MSVFHGCSGAVVAVFVPESEHDSPKPNVIGFGRYRKDKKLQRDFRIPNPIASLKMLWAKDTALIATIYGIFHMDFS